MYSADDCAGEDHCKHALKRHTVWKDEMFSASGMVNTENMFPTILLGMHEKHVLTVEKQQEKEASTVKTGPSWLCSFLQSQPDACGLTQMLSLSEQDGLARCQPLSAQRTSPCKRSDKTHLLPSGSLSSAGSLSRSLSAFFPLPPRLPHAFVRLYFRHQT